MMLRYLSLLWDGVAPAVKNHLWQSTFFLLLAALLAVALRRNHARARYGLWLAASVKFLVPFSLLVALGSHIKLPHRPAAPAQAGIYVAVDEFSQPFTAEFSAAAVPAPPNAAGLDMERVLPRVIAAVWFAGFAGVLCVWGVGWRRVSAAVRRAVPMGDGRELATLRRLEQLGGLHAQIPMVLSSASMEPGIFGIVRPELIWPAGMSARLDDAHLDAILAHEVCHVRRRDNLTAALHMLVEAIFWFHPLVWWLGARLVEERERACDEEVLRLCNRPEVYAEGILKVCEFCLESPLPCVSGVTGSDLKKRIMNVLAGRMTLRLGMGKKVLLVAAAAMVIAVPILLGQAQAARRMMLAAVAAAPKPVRAWAASHAMIELEEVPSTGLIAEAQVAADGARPADDVSLGPAFEVATIRPANRDDGRHWFGARVDASGRFTTSAEPLSGLVWMAYIHAQGKGKVSGGPKWAQSDTFDINAKVDDAYMAGWDRLSDDQRMDLVRPMIRRLLADRFRLKLKIETLPTPVYALVQAKGGAHVKEVSAPDPLEGDPMEARMKWMKENPDKPIPGGIMCSGHTCTGKAVRMSEAIGQISGSSHADRAVIDETGLKGYYDFAFTQPDNKDDSPMAEVEDDLGMKFEPRTVPMKTYTIDSAEKPSVDGAEVPAQADAVAVAMGQEKMAAESGQPQNTAAPLPRFEYEAATIKPSKGPGPDKKIGMWVARDGFSAWFITPQQIISIAYGVKSLEISGGPSWLPSERFDIEAKMDAATADALAKLSHDQRELAQQQMLQALLAGRFQLTVHRETKEGPTYTLVIAKGGPKLQEAKPGDTYPNEVTYPDGTHGGAGSMSGSQVSGDLTAQAVPIARLVQSLTQMLGHSVSDKTELKGVYDFKLQFTPDDRLQPPNGAALNARLPAPPSDSNAPSLFDALQEQLGLKLESGKGPVEVIVIDHVERPSAN